MIYSKIRDDATDLKIWHLIAFDVNVSACIFDIFTQSDFRIVQCSVNIGNHA
jgi:hypothetical protein